MGLDSVGYGYRARCVGESEVETMESVRWGAMVGERWGLVSVWWGLGRVLAGGRTQLGPIREVEVPGEEPAGR